MFIGIIKQLKTSLLLMLCLMVLTGMIYPGIVTVIAQLLFPCKANGSLVQYHGKIIGSEFIGQNFVAAENFWGRPSAARGFPYNELGSSGSNQGPSNPRFLTVVQKRLQNLQLHNPDMQQPVPIDLVTASGSGLDPEISPLAALYQVPRIAKARNISETELNALVRKFIRKRTFMIFGEPRINVLELNLALKDRYAGTAP
ncbi:MAG: potassium-transporting ATPase subunit C [Legionellales bacterium RIFCSPHIGHO2_12_FULL_42_9]|nr:MAG: potassium-transporting ATPase subunit C [Legionellales bacterium RIFCSPHIGHO2_12_FULL_42_9]